MKLRRSIPLLAGIVTLALACAAPALAQSPAQNAYSGVGADQLFLATPQSTASSLPFTGLDLAGVILAGLALAGAGLILRRWSTSSTK